MRNKLRVLVATTLIASSLTVPAFAVGSLDDAIGTNEVQTETYVETEQEDTGQQQKQESRISTERQEKNKGFINSMNSASDLTADIDGANEVTGAVKKFAGKIIGFLFYTIPVLLTLRVALDLTYIGVPFLRKILANGHTGAAPSGGQGMGAGMGMNQGMGMNSGMGMNAGMGMNRGMGAGAVGNGSVKIQLISNAALNAVAAEKAPGPDAPGPFKIYIKDMVVVLTLIPVLIVLAATGILTNVGLTLGSILVDFISNIQGMI